MQEMKWSPSIPQEGIQSLLRRVYDGDKILYSVHTHAAYILIILEINGTPCLWRIYGREENNLRTQPADTWPRAGWTLVRPASSRWKSNNVAFKSPRFPQNSSDPSLSDWDQADSKINALYFSFFKKYYKKILFLCYNNLDTTEKQLVNNWSKKLQLLNFFFFLYQCKYFFYYSLCKD